MQLRNYAILATFILISTYRLGNDLAVGALLWLLVRTILKIGSKFPAITVDIIVKVYQSYQVSLLASRE